ncbi:aspartate aminotransferase family protein [Legionella sp. W05-934-2]|uniref:aspartate aminotransferase family protein n=1 Tax=Legionella sp. W05-934-2 TaxID=1198649 RepID=UPI003462247D
MNQLESLWMPFTANRYFKSHPKLLVKADGMYYTTNDNRLILDGTAGLWCVNAGHNQPKITEAIQQQAATMDYAPGFQMGHPQAFELAQQLAQIAPEPLNHVFFTNSGSESVDTALKIAMAYQHARGKPERQHFVGRERGYHGVGFGGISVGGIATNQKGFQLLSNVSHLPSTHDIAHNAFSKGQPTWGAHLADALLDIIANTPHIAAVIVEPVAGSTGLLVPPQGYLQRLRTLCDEHDILLIFDEVITGFGRVDGPFSAPFFHVIPDIITTAKGLTNGAVPMGAAIVRDDIYHTIVDSAPQNGIELFHGYTYSGHPLACAAALASLTVFEEQGLYHRAQQLSEFWQHSVHSLRGLPHIVDIRNIGLAAAIELEPIEGAPGQRARDVFNSAFDKGALVRYSGETIVLSPPLIIEQAQITQLVSILADSLSNKD